MNELQEKRVIRARTALMLESPFFASLVLRLRMVEADWIPTFATDGRRLLYNPKFAAQLTDAEVKFVVAHEVLHCACLHPTRRGSREPLLANIAMDFVVNPILVEAKIGQIPNGCLLDPQFNNMYFEQVYELLRKDVQKALAQAGKGPGFGEVIDPQSGDGDNDQKNGQGVGQAERAALDEEWKVAAQAAAMNAKAAGNIPGGIDRMITEAQRPKVDWREVLRPFVQQAMDPKNYRWTPPNRRFVWQGMYLPSVEREGIGPIDVHVDVSGSIDQDMLNQWAAELNCIVQETRPEKVRVLYFDAALQGDPVEFGPDEPVTLTTRGGGGTDFKPSFEYVEKHGPDPICAVVLTDLECNSYPQEPLYPVLWATPSSHTAPWGETVRIEAV